MNKRAFSINLLFAFGLPSLVANAAAQPQQNGNPALAISLAAPEPAAGTLWTEPKTGMDFVWVPGGSFVMGSNHGGSDDNLQDLTERPVHRVSLKGFWMGRYEVTQAQYQKLTGKNPSVFGGVGKRNPNEGEWKLPTEYVQPLDNRNHPVESVSFDDAKRFTRKMSAISKTRIELPSEAQWEYACRAGGAHKTYCGGEDKPDRIGWYEGNSGKNPYEQEGQRTYKMVPHHPVGQLSPNNWGLYDMSGNVEEWTQDCFNETYQGAPNDGSAWKSGDCRLRVTRGGNWGYSDEGISATARGVGQNGDPSYATGFRVIRSVP